MNIREPKAYFIDIDGCIMPSLFPNLTTSKQTHDEMRSIIKSINKNGRKIKPYKAFSNFFFNNIFLLDRVYFVTGRQESAFGELTRHQLHDFITSNIDVEIIFYPEDGVFEEHFYSNWKYQTIKLLSIDNGINHVFDDNNIYFLRLDLSSEYPIRLHTFSTNKDWKGFNRTIRSNNKNERELDILLQIDYERFSHPLFIFLDYLLKIVDKILGFISSMLIKIEINLFKKHKKKERKNECRKRKKKIKKSHR